MAQDTITMLAPDGTARAVPMAQRDAALKSGGREVVKILDPTGTARWAPKDDLSKYLAAGAKVAPSLPSAPSAPQPEARTPGNYAKESLFGLGRGLKNTVVGLGQSIAHPIKTVTGMRDQLREADAASQKEFQDLGGDKKDSFAKETASALTFAEHAPVIGGMVQYAERGGTKPGSPEAVGAGVEAATTLEAPKLAGQALVAGARALLPDMAAKAARAAAGAGPKTVRDLVKETKALNEKGAADTATANDTEAAKAETTRKTELAKHASDKASAAANNQDVQEGLESDLAAQRKIGPITQKLTNARAALRAAVETAREKALKVGNEKYNTVNKVLNPIAAQPEFYQYVASKASDEIAGSKGSPTYLKSISQRIKSDAPIRYEDLQSDYSNLGRELSKGTLPGDVYHAYDVMHEAIGEEMQRIADSQQMGGHLTDARNYWRRMKQTFGKPITFTDAASKAIGGVKDEAQENAIRLLGSFDPSIPRIAAHVANIEKGVAKMPEPTPERVLTEKAASQKVPVPGEGLSRKLELTPRPTPKTFEPQKIGPEEVAGAKGKGIEAREKQISHRTGWVAAGSLIYATLDMLKGVVPSPVGVGASVGGSLAIQAAVTKMLTSPKVVDFLTKATPADVAQIPPELRGDFPKLLSAAQKRGIKISPALTAGFTTAAIAGKQNDSNK